MICPQCQTQSQGSDCAICQPATLYEPALVRIQSALAGISRGEAPLDRCQTLFSSLMGTVGQVLDQASDDLQKAYRGLGPEVGEFVVDFGDIQDDMHQAVRQIGAVFSQCDSLDDFQIRLPIVEGYMTSLQASLDALGQLERKAASPTLAEHPRRPVPAQVSRALGHYDAAIKALVLYIDDNRDLALIQECLDHAELAKAKLEDLLSDRDSR